MLKLDYSAAKVMQISNDAFFYFTKGENPLDEDNLKEAQELSNAFPNGFFIGGSWEFVKGTDLIRATFIPYIKDEVQINADFDEYENLTSEIQHQIKWLDPETIRLWRYNSKTDVRELRGDFKVRKNKHGLLYFHTGDQSKEFTPGKMSMYFLKHYKKRD